ncbi:MAG: ABC transporter ATP-binding protein [Acidobacteria bacterium]|nr:ABC transporter ATP-binding protein [Acidobacteriota bacterium]
MKAEIPQVMADVLNLRKVYRRDSQEITVLDGINVRAAKGDFLALMGPSGSDKTTMLNLLAGIDKPTSGKVIVAGTDVAQLSESALARWRSLNVGFIFQFYNLIPVLTAVENVALPLLLRRLSKPQRHDRALTALRVVGLADRADHYPRQLSGGQEPRVAIARAIVTDPNVLVADEPTGLLGSLLALPANGITTSTTSGNFTELSFALSQLMHSEPHTARGAYQIQELVCFLACEFDRAHLRRSCRGFAMRAGSTIISWRQRVSGIDLELHHTRIPHD